MSMNDPLVTQATNLDLRWRPAAAKERSYMAEDIRGSAPILSTKDVILEMRTDLKDAIRMINAIAVAQNVMATELTGVKITTAERRNVVDQRLETHDSLIDGLIAFRNETKGAVTLARWALGTSLLGALIIISQFFLALSGHPIS